ncbi:uncharacterized protein LOC129906518 [Episyrphus balteatus]|uniref:uncharacterized protein LOC129906518 n=1 Tax=Episyrphus balteatus TaxID=286459 RepID=UPI002485004B|nr:uncharacterized protein LOC129906518 [Episyrphus balteatus]
MLRSKNYCCNQQSSHLAILICIYVVQYVAAATVVGSLGLASGASVSNTTSSLHNLPQEQANTLDAGTYEIRAVSGEPNYKSVNLTWEVEFVPATTNDTDALPPPKTFQIFYCEMQSFGPHRCRSKVIEDKKLELDKENEPIMHYTARVDNLRMATKYSFHIKPQLKKKNLKISGRSELLDNEVENDLFQGQSIIIPTKGFSAQATKCLPHASEIEVETGPYFGGKIAVDGGNCGVRGNPKAPTDKYVMRIDHKMCGSLVKPETNTVETFITVQENLGIFTHSTRRFVVVCSFQSGMQTVRASFTVPGKGGVAAAVENDPFEPDRMGREQRQMNFVDKSGLVLKEEASVDEEEVSTMATVAIVEDIIPGVNEEDIKHEPTEAEENEEPVMYHRQAKFAKLINQLDDERGTHQIKSDFQNFAGNLGSVVLTVSLSVIMVGVFVYVVFRESRRNTISRRNMQQLPKSP